MSISLAPFRICWRHQQLLRPLGPRLCRKIDSVDDRQYYLGRRNASSFLGQANDYLKYIASTPTDYFGAIWAEKAIISLHGITGNHWSTDIVLITVLLKVFVSLPLNTMKEINAARYLACRLATLEYGSELRAGLTARAARGAITEREANEQFYEKCKTEKNRLVQKYNCHPLRSGICLAVDILVWVIYFLALRNLSLGFPAEFFSHENLKIASESLAWIPNLAKPDSTMVLPLAVGIISLTSTEFLRIQRKAAFPQESRLSKSITWIARGAGVGLIFFCTYLPSSVGLYWLTAGLLNLTQHVLFTKPTVRKLLRLPALPASSVKVDNKR